MMKRGGADGGVVMMNVPSGPACPIQVSLSSVTKSRSTSTLVATTRSSFPQLSGQKTCKEPGLRLQTPSLLEALILKLPEEDVFLNGTQCDQPINFDGRCLPHSQGSSLGP